jgi:hypothetical protein
MSTMADSYLHRAMPVLRRNPVLTAMMVYSLGFCVAASIAAFAAWRESSQQPILRRPAHPYLVQSASPVPLRAIPDAGLNRSRSRGGGFDQASSDG